MGGDADYYENLDFDFGLLFLELLFSQNCSGIGFPIISNFVSENDLLKRGQILLVLGTN